MPYNVFIMLLFCAYFTKAQTLFIYHKITKEPLENVMVSSEKPLVFGLSNAKGAVDISEYSTSTTINISIIGYKTLILSVPAVIIDTLNYKLVVNNCVYNNFFHTFCALYIQTDLMRLVIAE